MGNRSKYQHKNPGSFGTKALVMENYRIPLADLRPGDNVIDQNSETALIRSIVGVKKVAGRRQAPVAKVSTPKSTEAVNQSFAVSMEKKAPNVMERMKGVFQRKGA